MGDHRRFDIFSNHIVENLPTSNIRIVDVAGGKGHLRQALFEKGFSDVTTWDKRNKRVQGNQRFEYFNWETAPEYDILVAMHPDEGTDHSILYAAKWGIDAFICPCCAKGSAVTYWGYNCRHKSYKILKKGLNRYKK